jgi:hypothetical protein
VLRLPGAEERRTLRVSTKEGATVSEVDGTGRDEQKTDPEELAQSGGVGIGAGEPSTFEPEEDPESVEDA